jgi:hypothetical protein
VLGRRCHRQRVRSDVRRARLQGDAGLTSTRGRWVFSTPSSRRSTSMTAPATVARTFPVPRRFHEMGRRLAGSHRVQGRSHDLHRQGGSSRSGASPTSMALR